MEKTVEELVAKCDESYLKTSYHRNEGRKVVQKELKTVDFTGWSGQDPSFIAVPKTRDPSYQKAVMDMLLELDDHEAIRELVEFWELEKLGDDWYDQLSEMSS